MLGGTLYLIKWFQSPSKSERVTDQIELTNAQAKIKAIELRKIERELQVDILTPSEYLDKQKDLTHTFRDYDADFRRMRRK